LINLVSEKRRDRHLVLARQLLPHDDKMMTCFRAVADPAARRPPIGDGAGAQSESTASL
jgi:hypothetical protein